MDSKPKQIIFITGGSGFIGSHLIDVLINQELYVYAFDNLTSGYFQNVKRHLNNSSFSFINGDLLNQFDIKS